MYFLYEFYIFHLQKWKECFFSISNARKFRFDELTAQAAAAQAKVGDRDWLQEGSLLSKYITSYSKSIDVKIFIIHMLLYSLERLEMPDWSPSCSYHST